MVRSWNNGVCCMSFCILMNLWIAEWLMNLRIAVWQDCFVGHSCPGGICPESGPLSLTCSITAMLGTLLMIDTKHICSHWYIFPSKCAWKACFPILLTQGEIPASGSMHPSRWLPPHEKTKFEQGWPGSIWSKRWGIWSDVWVCLHYWVVIWVPG